MADDEDTNWFVSIFFQFSQIFSMVAQILRLQLKTYKLLIIKSVEEHTSAQEIGHKALSKLITNSSQDVCHCHVKCHLTLKST